MPQRSAVGVEAAIRLPRKSLALPSAQIILLSLELAGLHQMVYQMLGAVPLHLDIPPKVGMGLMDTTEETAALGVEPEVLTVLVALLMVVPMVQMVAHQIPHIAVVRDKESQHVNSENPPVSYTLVAVEAGIVIQQRGAPVAVEPVVILKAQMASQIPVVEPVVFVLALELLAALAS